MYTVMFWLHGCIFVGDKTTHNHAGSIFTFVCDCTFNFLLVEKPLLMVSGQSSHERQSETVCSGVRGMGPHFVCKSKMIQKSVAMLQHSCTYYARLFSCVMLTMLRGWRVLGNHRCTGRQESSTSIQYLHVNHLKLLSALWVKCSVSSSVLCVFCCQKKNFPTVRRNIPTYSVYSDFPASDYWV